MGTHARKKKKAAQRVIIFLTIVILCLSTISVWLLVDNVRLRNKLDTLSSDSTQTSSQDDTTSSDASSVTSSMPTVPAEDMWKLRLANRENVLPADFSVETGLITPKYARDAGMKFDARAVEELNNMLAAADRDGVKLLVISCFRTLTKQTNLYNAEVQKWLNQGYSDQGAKDKAATIVAVPGTSDHNLGLAVDLNSVQQTFENTAQFRWLQTNAADYGFVMRYPKDKQDITKIIYEPWHYRYVGVEHAKKMNELNMCLEEYVKYLGISS